MRLGSYLRQRIRFSIRQATFSVESTLTCSCPSSCFDAAQSDKMMHQITERKLAVAPATQ